MGAQRDRLNELRAMQQQAPQQPTQQQPTQQTQRQRLEQLRALSAQQPAAPQVEQQLPPQQVDQLPPQTAQQEAQLPPQPIEQPIQPTAQPQGRGRFIPEQQQPQALEVQAQRVSDLPELGQGGLLAGQDPLTGAAITPALLTATDPQEIGQILTSNFPGVIGITQTKEGELIATNNDTGVRVSLNKPGLSTIDVLQGLGVAAAFTPAGRVATGGLIGATTAAAASGLTSAAIEGVQALSGGEFDAETVALDAALGGIASGAVSTFKKFKANRAEKAAFESRFPKQRKSFENRFTTSKKFGRLSKVAQSQGFDADKLKVFASSTPLEKRKMLEMVKIAEKSLDDPIFAAANRPTDIAGDSLLRKINFVKKNQSDAGTQLGRVARGLKGKEVDIETPVNDFVVTAEGMGIRFDEDMIPSFEGSLIETVAPAKKIIEDIALKIRRSPTMDGQQAHEFKKFIDEIVTFGKSEGLKGRTEALAKQLRAGVNDSVRDISQPYRDANKTFSDSVSAIDDLQKSVGKTVDLSGRHSDKAVGTSLRGLMSNIKSRANMMTAIENIESVANKQGGAFDDNILSQSLFAEELERIFKLAPKTGFQGQVTAGLEGSASISALGLAAKAISAGKERAKGIDKPGAIKAIRKILIN
jgi:hypothetical protein